MANLKDINTTDIRDAIRLGCRTMSNVFNADDNDVPFFGAYVRPHPPALVWSDLHEEAQIPGRHLNALLAAESIAGVEIDEQVIEKHARAAFFAYSGPMPLPLNRETMDGVPIKLFSHNVREGFHALHALVRYRDCNRGRELAEGSIAIILERWDPDDGWEGDYLEGKFGLKIWGTIDSTYRDGNILIGLGRSVGPLVKYYRTTGYGPSLELALRLKDRMLQDCFWEEGCYDAERFGHHAHSITSSMTSLAQLADLLQDPALMNRVKTFYDNGLWSFRDQVGWASEHAEGGDRPDMGEMNTTGDILESALILGSWGFTQYYEDAERILRCHILPSQLRDISFCEVGENPNNEDRLHDVPNRLYGAFGFPAPYGHASLGVDGICFNLDVVGGTVGSLCAAYESITRFAEAGHRVNLLFDHETDAIKVESPYTHEALYVRLKRSGPLFVRIPSWVKTGELVVTGTDQTPILNNGYAFFPQPPVNRPIGIRFPLSEREMILKHTTRDIRVRLGGDTVVAMENFGADLTFFDPL